ncbi:unnamed protein product [Prunus brigantina]
MEDFRICLERQERERNERNRRADEINELQRQVDEQVVIVVALQDEENQGRRRGSQVGRRRNVDRHRHSRGNNLLEDYFIPTSLYFDCDAAGVLGLLPEQKLTAVIQMWAYGASADQGPPTTSTKSQSSRIGSIDCMHWQWKNCPTALQDDYRNRKGQKSIILEAVASFDTWVWHAFFGVAGSQNDLNVLGQSSVFNDVLRGQGPNITYQVNNTVYQTGYYLADGIYPRCFGIPQARWLIIRGAAHMFDEEILRSIMMTCIILHNMIVEYEYDYDAVEVYEPDPMNTALTRIYERPMGPSGEPFEPEPLVRDGHFMTQMIDQYTEMQSSYIHERCQLDLMEHLWAVKGNEDE